MEGGSADEVGTTHLIRLGCAASRPLTHPDMVVPVNLGLRIFSLTPSWVGTVEDRPPHDGISATTISWGTAPIHVLSTHPPGEGQGHRSRGTSLRRLINLISAGWLPT